METQIKISQEFLDTLPSKDRKIIDKAIELYEQFVDAKDAKLVAKAVKEGKMKTLSSQEVYEKHGV